jgi:hypothetical protein
MRGKKLKLVWIALITVVLSVDGMGLNFRPRTNHQQLTNTELQAARQLAIEFTTGFVRTTDLTPLIKDFFSKDFIERYTKDKSKDLGDNRSVDLYFVPGLDYNSRLLAEAGPEDWLRFYAAANNFVFFGFMSGIKNSRNAADITATKMYPSSVINLLNSNPTLSNMIVRKGSSQAVGSVAEMQRASATLEQAVSLMRQQTTGLSPVNINAQELIKAMQEDEFFRPTVETVDDQFFGLPQGTRVIFINTPILFRLMLVKTNNNKLEILWAEPYTGG